MLASQIFLTIIIFFILFKTVLSFKKEKLDDKKFYFFWIGFWLIVTVLVNFTQILSSFAKFLGIGRGVDLAVYTSIIAIFYLLFIFFQRIKKLEREITKIVREITIEE